MSKQSRHNLLTRSSFSTFFIALFCFIQFRKFRLVFFFHLSHLVQNDIKDRILWLSLENLDWSETCKEEFVILERVIFFKIFILRGLRCFALYDSSSSITSSHLPLSFNLWSLLKSSLTRFCFSKLISPYRMSHLELLKFSITLFTNYLWKHIPFYITKLYWIGKISIKITK